MQDLYAKANQLVLNGLDEKSSEVIFLLEQAVKEQHDIRALRTLNRFFCEAIHSCNRINPKKHFEFLKREEQYHRTLVYLMIAMTSLYYIQFDTAYCSIALEYLEKAEKSQAQDQYSKENIAKTNPWQFDNITEMKKILMNLTQ